MSDFLDALRTRLGEAQTERAIADAAALAAVKRSAELGSIIEGCETLIRLEEAAAQHEAAGESPEVVTPGEDDDGASFAGSPLPSPSHEEPEASTEGATTAPPQAPLPPPASPESLTNAAETATKFDALNPSNEEPADHVGGLTKIPAYRGEPAPDSPGHREAAAVMDRLLTPGPPRGPAAVVASADAAYESDTAKDAPKLVCTCIERWKNDTRYHREDVANEAHHKTCPLYKPGGHHWPLPSSGSGPGPHIITCFWCSETREVDQSGRDWLPEMAQRVTEIPTANRQTRSQRREAILEYIRQRPGSIAKDVANGLGMAQTNVYAHLHGLVADGLLTEEPHGGTQASTSCYRAVEVPA